MTVYVDRALTRFGRMRMSHLLADTEQELHEMAQRVGLKREWFQNHGTPHYDLCMSKRKLAIQAGAVEVDRKQMVALIRRLREGPPLSETNPYLRDPVERAKQIKRHVESSCAIEKGD
jgi:hypothetical protein